MNNRPDLLVVATSARALAASAHCAGYAPLAADTFADTDTLAISRSHCLLDLAAVHISQMTATIASLEQLVGGRQPIGLVYGSGLEDKPWLLSAIARRWCLLGNDAATVALAKDPVALAQFCAASTIPHPEISFDPPGDCENWLIKWRGKAGGIHVRAANPADATSSSVYFQRKMPGRNFSCLFLADGRQAMIVGLSRQWTSPSPRCPFRYGGAVQPAGLSRRMAESLQVAVHRLMAYLPLKGLNSADFLVTDECFVLLEINPRPGASLDIFESEQSSLVEYHIRACRGQLASLPETDVATAARVVYATEDITSFPSFIWPSWAKDRQRSGTRLKAGDPLCTVVARAPSALSARALCKDRAQIMLKSALGRAS